MYRKFFLSLTMAAICAATANAGITYGTPATGSGTPDPLFGTLIDFDDVAAGTFVGASDYASLGVVSLTETSGAGASFMRYVGSQSAPNYIGTGSGYDIGGSSSAGWDGTILFELVGDASRVGIGVANSVGSN